MPHLGMVFNRSMVRSAYASYPDRVATAFKLVGMPLTLVAHRTGGGSDTIALSQTYNEQQIAFTEAGIALNLIGQQLKG